MKIVINFLNGGRYWQDLVLENAQLASEILSDPLFLQKIQNWPKFDFTKHSPDEVAEKIAKAGDVQINVGFYSKWLTRAIAYEEDGAIYFNTRKAGAGGVGNIAHELMHALGYSHNGNSPAGQENTVPWRIGQWAETWKPAPKGCEITAAEGVTV